MKQFILSLFAFMLFVPQGMNAQGHASTQGLNVECLGVEHDGSQTLRTTGSGRNKTDALEQAKKNAVMAVIFTGVRGGKAGCDMRPLIYEPNAREKYARYFDIFFMNNGEYLQYTSMIDKRRGSNQKKTSKLEKTIRVTVRVMRHQLQQRLMNDGIIPSETLYDVNYTN